MNGLWMDFVGQLGRFQGKEYMLLGCWMICLMGLMLFAGYQQKKAGFSWPVWLFGLEVGGPVMWIAISW